jgi:hypothetical protein
MTCFMLLHRNLSGPAEKNLLVRTDETMSILVLGEVVTYIEILNA